MIGVLVGGDCSGAAYIGCAKRGARLKEGPTARSRATSSASAMPKVAEICSAAAEQMLPGLMSDPNTYVPCYRIAV